MLAKLTLKLAAVPEETWARFTVAHMQAEPLPTPLKHVAMASLISAGATGLGSAIRPGATAAGVVLQLLAGVVGYVGGTALAVLATPSLLRSASTPPELAARFASGAVLPVALSGVLNIVPLFPLTFLLAIAGAASSVWSGWIGADAMLALEGEQRKRAALVPAVLAVSLVLLATVMRMVMPK
jgi:hypothetical protein